MAKTKKESEKYKLARRKQKKECERKRRERIKSDPELYEEAKRKERERYHARKETGKIKFIHEITSVREQRAKRKRWKARSRKYRAAKKKYEQLVNILSVDSPPSSPGLPVVLNEPTEPQDNLSCPQSQFSNSEMSTKTYSSGKSRKESGRKKVKKGRSDAYRKIKKLEEELKAYKAKCSKYKSRYYREKGKKNERKEDTPNTKVKKLTKGLKVSSPIKRRLVFNEALICQMTDNFQKTRNKKESRKSFLCCVAGKIIKKYKCLNEVKKIFKLKNLKSRDVKEKTMIQAKLELIRQDIQDFLEDDSCSTLCPGKKDTITRKGVKKQKRYLNNSLQNLHKAFSSKCTQYFIHYSTFCKLRPFWCVQKKVGERDTCLCSLHENMKLMVIKLKQLKIISERTPDELYKSLCCDTKDNIEKCLERNCNECKNKKINLLEYSEEDTVSYEKWVLKKVNIVAKGTPKTVKKHSKDQINCSAAELVHALQSEMPKFMVHISNILHQQREMKNIKDRLKPKEVLIHMDFSENYECKYSSEIQAFHFGGSRQQVSIHTVIIYYRNELSTAVLTKSFCTLSDNLKHDPIAICTHLSPVLKNVKTLIPSLTTIHFLSDGPSTQYRNRTMFHLIATHFPSVLSSVKEITWNYSEAGHGKGAPDGLGGTLKRTADVLVARGKDISCFSQLVSELQKNLKSIEIIPIKECEFNALRESLKEEGEKFIGTMKVHQVLWARTKPNVLRFRKLSCFQCMPTDICSHNYDKGVLSVSPDQPGCSTSFKQNRFKYSSKILKVSDVYSDTDDEWNEEIPCKMQKMDECTIIKLPSTEDNLINTYVVAEFTGRKKTHHFVGMILEEDDCQEGGGKMYHGDFMTKNADNTFSFPSQKDLSWVYFKDIKQVLNDPVLTRRHTYLFKDLDLKYFHNLE